jgi:hypothetical protein
VRLMSPWEITALVRRHATAIAIVLILAAGLAYLFKHADPGYAETATVAFVAPEIQPGTSPFRRSLLVMDELMANSVMSARGQQQIRSAGGTAHYEVAQVNLNNEELPYYAVPYVTVTATSASAAAAGDTFSAVMKVLQDDLATLQAQQGAKPNAWIWLRPIAPPNGPVAQIGSPTRTLAGLAVLTVIASLLTAKFLDRHPFRLGDFLRERNRMDRAS